MATVPVAFFEAAQQLEAELDRARVDLDLAESDLAGVRREVERLRFEEAS